MSDEDDKATVVIDLNKLKKEKEKQEKALATIAENLEFNVGEEAASQATPEPMPIPQDPNHPVVMFEFQGKMFEALQDRFPDTHEFHLVATLPELNGWLKKKIPFILCLPLDMNPKGVNQLCVQLKAKFPQVHVILVGKTLNAQKVAIHQASPAGVSGYLVYPFTTETLSRTLGKLGQQSAA